MLPQHGQNRDLCIPRHTISAQSYSGTKNPATHFASAAAGRRRIAGPNGSTRRQMTVPGNGDCSTSFLHL